MSAVLSLWFSVVLLLLCGSSEGLNITAEPGENVILTCRTEKKYSLIVLVWTRDGLLPEEVFVFRDGQSSPSVTHKSYRNRVFLKDSQMKDGDLSVVLKNVTIKDSGTYQCRVIHENDPQREPKLISISLSVVPPGLEITAEPGEDVTLTCRTEKNDGLIVLEWISKGLENKTVFVFRDGRPDQEFIHESYKNRVFLKDSEMKDGDLSVVLENVMMNDTGTYQCRAKHENDPQRGLILISTIHLSVVLPGDPSPGQQGGKKEDGGTKKGGLSHGWIIGIVLSVLVVAVAAGLWIYRKKKGSNQSSSGFNNQQNPEQDFLNSDSTAEKMTTNTDTKYNKYYN